MEPKYNELSLRIEHQGDISSWVGFLNILGLSWMEIKDGHLKSLLSFQKTRTDILTLYNTIWLKLEIWIGMSIFGFEMTEEQKQMKDNYANKNQIDQWNKILAKQFKAFLICITEIIEQNFLVHHTAWKDENSVREQRTFLLRMIQKKPKCVLKQLEKKQLEMFPVVTEKGWSVSIIVKRIKFDDILN